MSSSQIWCACFLLSYPVKPLLYVCASPILLELWNLEVSWCEFHATMRPWSGLAASSERCENCQSISPVKFPLQYLHVSYPISSWKFQHGFWKMLSQKLLDRFRHGAGAVTVSIAIATGCYVRGDARWRIDQAHVQGSVCIIQHRSSSTCPELRLNGARHELLRREGNETGTSLPAPHVTDTQAAGRRRDGLGKDKREPGAGSREPTEGGGRGEGKGKRRLSERK